MLSTLSRDARSAMFTLVYDLVSRCVLGRFAKGVWENEEGDEAGGWGYVCLSENSKTREILAVKQAWTLRTDHVVGLRLRKSSPAPDPWGFPGVGKAEGS